MEEVQSVRGKGWVKFDEEEGVGGVGGVGANSAEQSQNNQSPGSLEVNLVFSDPSKPGCPDESL